MRIFLVYVLVPDETVCYYLPNLSDEQVQAVLMCHNHFSNGDNEPETDAALKWLNAYLDSSEGKTARVADYDPYPLDRPTTVVVSGFIL